MIWRNKGHEFDVYAETLLAANPRMKYYIFGAGILGKELMLVLRKYGCLSAFIDNSTDKQGNKIDEFDIISFEKYLEKRDGQIIISASKENRKEIKNQLEENSLKYRTDFFMYDEFTYSIFPIISVYYFDKSYVPLAQVSVTERCTLKCKKCAHGCFAVDNASKDLTLDQVCKSADCFFSKVDFIKEFVLIGGEPLLYKELAQAIQYIGEHYRNQIGTYAITTNGTIVPGEEVMKVCKKYNILYRISNYSRRIPRLKNSYQKLRDALETYDISYIFSNEDDEWMDYGFDYVDRGGDESELLRVFDACQAPCREIRENRFYFCVMARSVSENLKFNIGENDYLDLNKLDRKKYKKELLEFTLGYSEKGYLDMCRHCNGAEAENIPIHMAEQMEKA